MPQLFPSATWAHNLSKAPGTHPVRSACSINDSSHCLLFTDPARWARGTAGGRSESRVVTGTPGGNGRLSLSFPTENGILPAHCPPPPQLLWESAFPQALERADRFVFPWCSLVYSSTTMSQTGASGRCSGHFFSKGGGGECFQQEQWAFSALAAGFGDRKRKPNFSLLRPAMGKLGAGKLNAVPCWSFSVSQHQNVHSSTKLLSKLS